MSENTAISPTPEQSVQNQLVVGEAKIRTRFPRVGDVLFGSDAPAVEPVDPRRDAIAAGVTRVVLSRVAGIATLHQRVLPITGHVADHIVIAPAAVLVISSRAGHGKIRATRRYLRTGLRDLSAVASTTLVHSEEIAAFLDHQAPVEAMVCVVGASAPRLGNSMAGSVLVESDATLPVTLRAILEQPGPLRVGELSAILDHELPPA